MVDTPDENTFAIADIFEDRIEIRGFGREDSRSLLLSAPKDLQQGAVALR
jgi:hypothetical protein